MTASDEPFGRQPKPVTITIRGDDIDVEYWMREIMRRAEHAGDIATKTDDGRFVIYPRAVND